MSTMLSSLKRVGEEENEEVRRVRQRKLADTMMELEELVVANMRITDDSKGRKVDRMWKGEKGEGCGDCSRNWVHQCTVDR